MKKKLFFVIQLFSFFSLSISSAQTQETQEPIYDRACFERSFEHLMKENTGGAHVTVLPDFIDTRTEYMTFCDAISGGGLTYQGVCGLSENEKQTLIRTCLQNELDNVAGGIIELPLEIDSDEEYRPWIREISGGGASFIGSCEI